MESVKNAKNKVFCHDCGKEIKIEGKEIKNGVMAIYEHEGEHYKVFKCNDCFNKDSGLRNFQQCEVYSRVVGYLRPVSQWNWAKQEEYKKRKEFKV